MNRSQFIQVYRQHQTLQQQAYQQQPPRNQLNPQKQQQQLQASEASPLTSSLPINIDSNMHMQPNFLNQQAHSPTSPTSPASSTSPTSPTSPTQQYKHYHQQQQQLPMNEFHSTAQSVTSDEITPTNQTIKTVQPAAPKKASRPRYYKLIHSLQIKNIDRSDSAVSNASSGSSFSHQAHFLGPILNDPTFAPPPKFPKENLSVVKMRFFGVEKNLTVKSTLPSYDLVKHSGECMARFSLKSMIIKKWRQCFWIAYGDNQILFFRSKVDFEEWVSNPYLTKEQRDKLIKLNIDFVNDLYKPGVNGYSATNIRVKGYNRNGSLQHFKLERWLDYGPMIAAAFASKNQNDVYCLRRLMSEMIDKSPQRKRKSRYYSSASSAYDSDSQSIRSAFSRHSNRSSASPTASVKSAPAIHKYSISSQDYGFPSQSHQFIDQTRRSRSVEPSRRWGRKRFGREEKANQSSDNWAMDPIAFNYAL